MNQEHHRKRHKRLRTKAVFLESEPKSLEAKKSNNLKYYY
jgi:hypothetical protein